MRLTSIFGGENRGSTAEAAAAAVAAEAAAAVVAAEAAAAVAAAAVAEGGKTELCVETSRDS